jgi:hypothetical protein
MRGTARRVAVTLGCLALTGGLIGAECEPSDPVVTLESLHAQVEAQRIALCAVYADRGLTLDLPTFDDPDCP